MAGPSYLYKSYMGDVPWNAMMDWLSEDRELFSIVTKAFRLVSSMAMPPFMLAIWSSGLLDVVCGKGNTFNA